MRAQAHRWTGSIGQINVNRPGRVRLRRRGRRQARRIRAAIRRLPDDRTPTDYAIRGVAKLNFRALAVRVPARFHREPLRRSLYFRRCHAIMLSCDSRQAG